MQLLLQYLCDSNPYACASSHVLAKTKMVEIAIEDNMIDCTTVERPSIESAETVSREAEEDTGDFEGGKLNEKDKKKLIKALKDHLCLWSTSHSEYKDKLKKVSASTALASHFSWNGWRKKWRG